MGILGKTFKSLDDLLKQQLHDLYDAEHRLTDALLKMAEKASSPELATAFAEHLQETKGQIARLEKIFSLINEDPKREKCHAITGLIKEGEDMLAADGAHDVIDAGLIASAQRVEHYEIAGYGSARTFAQRLGYSEVASLLEQTLNEEKRADAKLTGIAESGVNAAAQAAA